MSVKIQNSRTLLKRSTLSGGTPTIGPSANYNDGTWGVNDIYPGELYLNMEDRKLWFGYEDSSGGTGTVLINPFNGTSGSCITDLYVTNVYGCSPITFHDELRHVNCTSSGTLSVAFGRETIASGNYSTASGYKTSATTEYSTASGYWTTASGDYGAFAQGRQTTASSNWSHAEGGFTTASGQGSHAEGGFTTASGSDSHAEGVSTTASGNGSHSEGLQTSVSGLYSHAEGAFTTASGNYSHAEGGFTTASGDTSHAEGGSTIASGNLSHTEGFTTLATGYSSHAEGNTTESNGDSSHAEGYLSKSNGEYSHAEGNTTLSSGQSSHAEGQGTTASGNGSHAEGYFTIASGNYSHVEGNNTTASGNYSHAEGYGTIAVGNFQHVSGKYNITGSTEGSFIIGNGVSDLSRSNLLVAADSGVTINGGLTATTYYGNGSNLTGISSYVPYPIGYWLNFCNVGGTSIGTASILANYIYASIFTVRGTVSLDRVRARVSTLTGGAGSTKIGIWKYNTSSGNFDLTLQVPGIITTNVTTNAQELTFTGGTLTLQSGIYAFGTNGNTTASMDVVSTTLIEPAFGFSSVMGGANWVGTLVYAYAYTGTLPSTITTSTSLSTVTVSPHLIFKTV